MFRLGVTTFAGRGAARVAAVLVTVALVAGCLALSAGHASAAVALTETALPTAGCGPYDIAVGSDGRYWVTEYNAGRVARCDSDGSVLNEYNIPTAISAPTSIVSGPDGNLWFTEFMGDKIGRITTAGDITEYNVPTPAGGPWYLTVGPDGNIWFTESAASRIGRCTLDGAMTEFSVGSGAAPRGITSGPDGNLWFTETGTGSITRMTTEGAFTRYTIPTAGSLPWFLCVGPDGNLWFTEQGGNKIGRCTASGNITEYTVPTAASDPRGIIPGPDGSLWFCESAGNRIGRCTTAGEITEYNVPTAGAEPWQPCAMPDGSIWFGESSGSRLGRLEGYETPSWYLAEGSTEWGFSTYITIQNPNPAAVHAGVTYMPTGSSPISQLLTLPANSQTTLTNGNLLAIMGGPRDFSTRVVCAEGLTIAVDRTMEWTGPEALSPESHNSIGVTRPARRWFLAEGSSAWGFECWLLVQNPTAYPANCVVTYMIEGEGPREFVKVVEPNSRLSFNMADDIGAKDASIEIVSSVPVIPERAMYRNNRREGHGSIGTLAPALSYFLAEGTTAWGFTTYLLIQNPNEQECDVRVYYHTGSGMTAMPPFTMPANSRRTIRVNDAMPHVDLSTMVEGSRPIIAERAMYLPSASGEVCHDTIGFTAMHRSFYLPDGQSTDGRETFMLVQNPNPVAVDVRIDYLPAGGAGIVSNISAIPPGSRRTYVMSDDVVGRGSALVSCTSGQKIMVERAMYWNARQEATCTIGGFTD